MVEGTEDMVRLAVIGETAGAFLRGLVLKWVVVRASLGVVLTVSNGILDLRMRNDMKTRVVECEGYKDLLTERYRR